MSVLRSTKIISKVCHCPTNTTKSRKELGGHQEPGVHSADAALREGARARGWGSSKRGNRLDFDLEILSAERAIDPITFKYLKWKWLMAYHNIKGIERLWSSGYDIGFPSL